MPSCTRCNYTVADGEQANQSSFVGPCQDGHQFPQPRAAPAPAGTVTSVVNLSETFAKSLVPNHPTSLTSIADLKNLLDKPIPEVVLPAHHRDMLMSDTTLPCRPSSQGEHMLQVETTLASGYMKDNLGTSEEMFATAADRLTGDVWQMLDGLTRELGMKAERNKTDPSGASGRGLRPDYCLWNEEDILLLKGEHKDASLEEAKGDLIKKVTEAFFIGLPLLPCYAVGGKRLQFTVLSQSANGTVLQSTISKVFNMDRRCDRLDIMAFSIKMYRVLVALHRMAPRSMPKFFQTVPCNDGDITVETDHVCKRVREGCEAPHELYELLNDIDNTTRVELKSVFDGMATLRITPVCLPLMPVESDLGSAIRSVLIALKGLHEKEFCHRDVRWPNVLFDKSRNRWLLSDFELSAPFGTVLAGEKYLGMAHFAPSYRDGKMGCSGATDIWQVGMLVKVWMERCSVQLGAAAEEFADQLLGDNPPTADQALQHKWLRCDKDGRVLKKTKTL